MADDRKENQGGGQQGGSQQGGGQQAPGRQGSEQETGGRQGQQGVGSKRPAVKAVKKAANSRNAAVSNDD